MSADERIFVDTNVLVYAYDTSAGVKHETARNLLRELWQSGTGCLSVQVLQELAVTLTQKIPTPLDTRTTTSILEDLTHWRIHEPGAADVVGALELRKRFQLSFWDAMLLRSAAELECVTLYSEDLNAGQRYGSVLVVNPFQE
ncbi:MAG: PIN domain-containing protein [Gaiellales bacterium]